MSRLFDNDQGLNLMVDLGEVRVIARDERECLDLGFGVRETRIVNNVDDNKNGGNYFSFINRTRTTPILRIGKGYNVNLSIGARVLRAM